MSKIRTLILILFVLVLISCQKNLLWIDDVECLLTEWTNKSWENLDSGTTRTYYWSNPRVFRDSDSSWGYWILPLSGVLRETHFKGIDTVIKDYKVIRITNELFVKQLLNDSTAPKIIYNAKK